VVLLDATYGRDAFAPGDAPGRYVPHGGPGEGGNKKLLGEDQWAWLEQTLGEPALVRVIVSPLQVAAEGSDRACWRMFPEERRRLLGLLRGASGTPVILSGGRDLGGVYRYRDPAADAADGSNSTDAAPAAQWDVHEITSGSLTHTGMGEATCADSGELCDEPGRNRLGRLLRENNYGLLEFDWGRKEIVATLRRTDTWPYHVGSDGNQTHAGDLLTPRLVIPIRK